MIEHAYTLKAVSRISAATGPEKGNHTAVHRVIPGAVVRGALAAEWWRQFGSLPAAALEFADLFDQGLRVGQAVPNQARLLSASAQVCKYRKNGCDTVIDRAVLLGKESNTMPGSCPSCNGALQDRSGWQPDGLRAIRLTAAELGEDETPKDGQLYSRDALSATTTAGSLTFAGRIAVRDAGGLAWLEPGTTLQIGAKRSLSLGMVRVTLTAQAEPAVVDPAPRTIIRLASPAIVVDEYGSPTLSQDALVVELSRASNNPLQPVAPIASWIRTELVTGWHMQSALPKPADWAMAAGSCVVVTGLTADGQRQLTRGIGYRTAEGYGAVEILDPRTFAEPPEPLGVAAAQQFKATIAPSPARAQAVGAARKALPAAKAAYESGTDPEAVISAAVVRAGKLMNAEKNALRKLLSIDPGAIDDAIEALR